MSRASIIERRNGCGLAPAGTFCRARRPRGTTWAILVLLVVGLVAAGGCATAADVATSTTSAAAVSTGPTTTDLVTTAPSTVAGPDLDALLQPVVDGWLTETNTPGVTVHMRFADGGEWSGAAGMAAPAAGIPVDPGDLVVIDSVTKTMVASAMLLLAEDGLVDLDGAVRDVVPGFAGEPAVTIRQLLAHTAGIHDGLADLDVTGQEAVESLVQLTPHDVVMASLAAGPDFAPGERFAYSNAGYLVAGEVIEAATGDRLGTVLRTRIFDPLGMNDTHLAGTDPIPAVTPPFGFEQAGPYAEGVAAVFWAAGGIVSTAADLTRFFDALVNRALLQPSSLDEMLGSVRPGEVGGRPTGYGLGIMTQPPDGGELVSIGHIGGGLGYAAAAFVYPEQGVVIAVLSNGTAWAADLADALAAALGP